MQRWLLAPILAGALVFITGRNHESGSARNIVLTLAAIMAAIITFANALHLTVAVAGGAPVDPAVGVSGPAAGPRRPAPAQSEEVTLTEITTGFNEPVGIDHYAPTNEVVISVNYPTGSPHNFELVSKDGERERFSSVSGLTDEVKIATARDRRGGFQPGELFVGTGTPGVVARVSADGSTIEDPWVTLPEESGLLRGSLHVDRTGVFGGDLIVVTTEGGVWRVSSSGNATMVANVAERLEGLTTIPNEEEKYGPWAGKILAGAEEESRIYAIDADGNFDFYELGIEPEDIDVIAGSENFFGVDYGGSTLWGAPPAEFAEMVGDVLIAQEHPGILWHVRWDGEEFDVREVARVSQWEHVTFSSAGISEVAPTTDTGDGSGTVLLAALGVLAVVVVAETGPHAEPYQEGERGGHGGGDRGDEDVAVAHVRQLVGQNPLQLGAVHHLHDSRGHRHHRVLGIAAGGKGIGLLRGDQIDLGHRHALPLRQRANDAVHLGKLLLGDRLGTGGHQCKLVREEVHAEVEQPGKDQRGHRTRGPTEQLTDPDEDRAEHRHQHQGLEVVAHGGRLPVAVYEVHKGRLSCQLPASSPQQEREPQVLLVTGDWRLATS